MSAPIQLQRPTTQAFFIQSVLAFAVALIALVYGITKLPLGMWERGFLALGLTFVVTSSFNLAKCVRDRQELSEVTSRVDQARIDKLLTEHDPFDLKQP